MAPIPKRSRKYARASAHRAQRDQRERRVLSHWPAMLFFLAVTIYLSWPLAVHLNAFVVTRVYGSANQSDLAWHLEALKESTQAFWQGKNPLLLGQWEFSPDYLLLGIPALSIGIAPIVYHNLFFLAVFFCSGFFMYLYVRERLHSEAAALLAGFAYVASPYIMYAYFLGHSPTIQVQFIPLIFLFLDRIVASEHPRVSDGVKLGVVLGLQALAVSQTTVYLTFFIPLYLAMRWIAARASRQKRLPVGLAGFARAIAIALVVSAIVAGPYLLMKLGTPTVVRTLEENSRDYWRLFDVHEFIDLGAFLNPGYVPLVLGLIGIAALFAWRQRQQHRAAKSPGASRPLGLGDFWAYPLMMIVGLLGMIGPVSPWLPYYWLYRFWPLVDHFRVPFRLFPFFLFALAVLSAIGFLWLTSGKGIRRHRLALALGAILLMVITQVLVSSWFVSLLVIPGPFPFPYRIMP